MSKQQRKQVYIELLGKIGSGFEAVLPSIKQLRRDHPFSEKVKQLSAANTKLHEEKTDLQNGIHKLRQQKESISMECDYFRDENERLQLKNIQLVNLICLLNGPVLQ